jgi:hypothetical protein
MTTTRLGAAELAPGQSDPDVTVNEALAYAMTLANDAICVQVSLNTPPGSPAQFDTYVCGASPTGAWSGKAKNIAFYYNSTWKFIAPVEGMEAYDQGSNDKYVYDGSSWSVSIPSGGGAPSVADYLVKTANGSLSAERVVTDTSEVTWDWATAGQAKAQLGFTVTTFAKTFLDDTNASGVRTTLGLVIGTDIEAHDADLTTIAGLSPSNDDILQRKSGAWANRTMAQLATDLGQLVMPTESFVIACSDETTALTTGTAKVTFRMPYAFTLTDVRASVTTAPTGGTLLTVDVNESGTTILSTKLTFDASEKTTTTAATPRVISDSALADDAEITIDIDAVGSTVAGAGLKVYLIGHQ